MVISIEKRTIREELEEIRKCNDGFIDPAKIVEYARNPDTALHGQFTWDDTKAAEQYRFWQARQVIRLEFDIIPGKNGVPREVRAFVSLIDDRRGEEERGYRYIIDVLDSSELRIKLLEEAKKEMTIFRRKYGLLVELAEIFEVMDKVK